MDLAEALKEAHHGEEFTLKFPVVGYLVEDDLIFTFWEKWLSLHKINLYLFL